jgi:hypothetical protein
MVSAGVINSVFFGVYSQVLKVLGNSIDKEHDHPDYLKVGIASSVAGMAQLIIACPIEVIKVVLQSQIPHGVHKGKIPHGVHEGKVPHGVHKGNIKRGLGIMVLNTSFNNVSIISWQSVLLVEEIGVPGENH